MFPLQTCKNDENESNHLGYDIQDNANFLSSSNMYTNYQDAYIPFPRTSGAKFCCVGTYKKIIKNTNNILYNRGLIHCFNRYTSMFWSCFIYEKVVHETRMFNTQSTFCVRERNRQRRTFYAHVSKFLCSIE